MGDALTDMFVVGAVTASLIFDVIVLFLALYKELVLWKRGLKSNLMAVLIRDQLLLFVLCCGANLANMVSFSHETWVILTPMQCSSTSQPPMTARIEHCYSQLV